MTGYQTGDNNQLLSDGIYDYAYDDEGNRISREHISSGAFTEYEWDHRNRLIKVTERVSLSGSVVWSVEYIYDIFGHRIAKLHDADGNETIDVEERFIYDGLRYERGNSGDHVLLRFVNGDLANRYLHGPQVDQIFADEQVMSLTSPGDVLWTLADHLGTIRDLAEYDAGQETTTVANHRVYDSYGSIVSQTDAAVDHLFGYTGREWDEDVDLQYNRARWYDPAVGRWLSEDPIGFGGEDANLRRYVANTPTAHSDPSGLQNPSAGNSMYDEFLTIVIPGSNIQQFLNEAYEALLGRWADRILGRPPLAPDASNQQVPRILDNRRVAQCIDLDTWARAEGIASGNSAYVNAQRTLSELRLPPLAGAGDQNRGAGSQGRDRAGIRAYWQRMFDAQRTIDRLILIEYLRMSPNPNAVCDRIAGPEVPDECDRQPAA